MLIALWRPEPNARGLLSRNELTTTFRSVLTLTEMLASAAAVMQEYTGPPFQG